MKTVTSRDGTIIAYDQSGQGPLVILVDGALQYRAFDQGMAQLADLLAPHFTVIHYDRRGRGDSTDTQPYSVSREIEDIEALIDKAGGSACLYGISSGAALAMEAAAKLDGKVKKLVMYEAPYNDDETTIPGWKNYLKELREVLAADRRGDAVGLFMMLVGLPADQLDGMRQHPMWPMWEAVGHTLAYDHIGVMGEEGTVPVDRAARVSASTLVITGSETFPFMHETAKVVAKAIPNAEHRTLQGQTHEVDAKSLAPVLIDFFNS